MGDEALWALRLGIYPWLIVLMVLMGFHVWSDAQADKRALRERERQRLAASIDRLERECGIGDPA